MFFMKKRDGIILVAVLILIVAAIFVGYFYSRSSLIGVWKGSEANVASNWEANGVKPDPLNYTLLLFFDKNNELIINATDEYGGVESSRHNYKIINQTSLQVSGYLNGDRYYNFHFQGEKLYLTGRLFSETEDRELVFAKVE